VRYQLLVQDTRSSVVEAPEIHTQKEDPGQLRNRSISYTILWCKRWVENCSLAPCLGKFASTHIPVVCREEVQSQKVKILKWATLPAYGGFDYTMS